VGPANGPSSRDDVPDHLAEQDIRRLPVVGVGGERVEGHEESREDAPKEAAMRTRSRSGPAVGQHAAELVLNVLVLAS